MDNLIFSLLLLEGNEASSLNGNAQFLFKQLVVEIVKIKYDVRWCSNLNCQCWPETQAKRIIEDESLKGFLIKNKLYEEIKLSIVPLPCSSDRTVWAEDGDHVREGSEYL